LDDGVAVLEVVLVATHHMVTQNIENLAALGAGRALPSGWEEGGAQPKPQGKTTFVVVELCALAG
jgi:hypothetical protein